MKTSVLLFLFLLSLSLSSVLGDSLFERCDAEDDVVENESLDLNSLYKLTGLTLSNKPTTTRLSDAKPDPDTPPKPTSSFDYWDEDEFEGVPIQTPPPPHKTPHHTTPSPDPNPDAKPTQQPTPTSRKPSPYLISFLIIFLINYFTGKRENENLARSWAAKFATEDSIFGDNFRRSKEGRNVFKFYASGPRFCSRLVATMELKSRHDLISRIYSLVVPCKDEITFEAYMNDNAMDHVVFALAKKKALKRMHKEMRDLNCFASLVPAPNGARRWMVDELGVISESKEVAWDLVTVAVLEQVFGVKAFEKYGKGFISMHFSDQHPGIHKKVLMFKFALPDANNMADMTRLVALVPYYVDLIGQYKLRPQARSKIDAARSKAAQWNF